MLWWPPINENAFECPMAWNDGAPFDNIEQFKRLLNSLEFIVEALCVLGRKIIIIMFPQLFVMFHFLFLLLTNRNHAEYQAVSACQRKHLQITAEEIGQFSMRAATDRGSIPRVYCHRSIHYIVHCVGDEVWIALIVLLLCYSRHALWGNARSLTEWSNTPGRPGWQK
jgi:hypothetical protein